MSESIVLDTPEGIAFATLASIKGRLKLEMRGLRFKGRPTTTVVAAMAGKPRMTRQAALTWVESKMAEMLAQKGA